MLQVSKGIIVGLLDRRFLGGGLHFGRNKKLVLDLYSRILVGALPAYFGLKSDHPLFPCENMYGIASEIS